MGTVVETIDVEVPVRTAYDQWTQFEEFPRFMEGVEAVRQLDDTHLHWVAEIAGIRREWDAVITEQVPDRRIAWTSIDGTRNAGVVTFESLGPRRCRVEVQIDVEPEGLIEQAGDRLGVIRSRTGADLRRFRDLIEARGVETGAWRGRVEPS